MYVPASIYDTCEVASVSINLSMLNYEEQSTFSCNTHWQLRDDGNNYDNNY
jgi:hypothetical protein